MSKLGNINNQYGKELNIAIANTDVKQVLTNAVGLPANMLIVTAPGINGVDKGTSDIIITDSDSVPVQITHTIQEGNGLYLDNDDKLRLHIDNQTVINSSGALGINLNQIIDNDTIKLVSNKLTVSTDNLTKAASGVFGLFKIDNDTVKIVKNAIYANTSSLTKSNKKNYGIARGDQKTIKTYSGELGVETTNLSKGASGIMGILMPDNNTIEASNGQLKVVTKKLTMATSGILGIAYADEETMHCENGILSVIQSALPKCSNTTRGVTKINSNSLVIGSGIVGLKQTDAFSIDNYENLLAEIDELETIAYSQVEETVGTIHSLAFNTTSVVVLSKPKKNDTVLTMPAQQIIVTMNVCTTANFMVTVNFDNNIMPQITVKQIVFNNSVTYKGVNCLQNVFEQTYGKEMKLAITLECFNYNSSIYGYNDLTNSIITVSDADNNSDSKSVVFSIVRFNSAFTVKETSIIESERNKYVYRSNTSESQWIKNYNALSSSVQQKLQRAQYVLIRKTT